ncbi:replication initiator [Nonomuraea polychroma]|uniref:replication initiator n=1 Tax=Nonomuraea polychroma TaxID=46176 RepID=UPI003D941BA8
MTHDPRTALINGLLELAAFLENHPEVPVSKTVIVNHFPRHHTDAEKCAEIDQAIRELAELRLADWAHMLGFRGHFSTRSRRYSTTLGQLRAAREHHARDTEITTGRLPLYDEDTVLVISEWEYAGKGHSAGDQLLAAALTGTQLGGPHDR